MAIGVKVRQIVGVLVLQIANLLLTSGLMSLNQLLSDILPVETDQINPPFGWSMGKFVL